jgi:ParB family transcriptional regulator, chromosome partitioning protein
MPLPKIADRFKGAAAELHEGQAQRISELEAKIRELEEAQEKGNSIEILRNELKSEFGEDQVDVTCILPNSRQPRRVMPEYSIDQMAGTLEQDGQLTPIVVVKAGNTFEIVDGHRRFSGAIKLGWKTIRAVVIPRPKDMLRAALLTFFHREDLNPLDEAEAITAYVQVEMEVTLEEFGRLLATAVRRLERKQLSGQMKSLMGTSPDARWKELNKWGFNSQECQLFEILLSLGVHPGSYKSNRLPILNLPSDLKEAILAGLGADHALALSRLNTKTLNSGEKAVSKLRRDLTEKVVTEKWTVLKTRQQVAETIASKNQNNKVNSEPKEVRTVRLEVEKLDARKLSLIDMEHLLLLQETLEKLQMRISQVLK